MEMEDETRKKIKEYEEKFLEIIGEYCSEKGERTKRKVISAIVAARETGQDLAPILEAKGMKVLSGRLQKFQREWEGDHKDWSYSLLVWPNVQNLFDSLAKKIFNHE